jgi:DNA-binding response OmpR family regulator
MRSRPQQPSVTILVDAQLHALVQPLLALAAARVDVVGDAPALLRRLWDHATDLVLIETASQHPGAVAALVAELSCYFPTPLMIIERGAHEIDRITWLERGADDVLTLQDTPLELPARCRALLRRAQRQRQRDPDARYLQALGMRLDIPARRVLLATGDTIDLNAAQTRLLALLLAQQGGVIPADVLRQQLFGTQAPRQAQQLQPILHDLRDRLSRAAGAAPQIIYVPGCGYRIAV